MIEKWTVRTIKLCDVKPQANNPRKIDPSVLRGLAQSIERFGYVELIVYNERTGNIVSGHQRYGILMGLGIQEAPMIVVNMSPEDELAASLTMNNPKIEGEFDEPIMELIEQVEKNSKDTYHAVRMDSLKDSLEKTFERASLNPDSLNVDDKEWDTECPCCGNKWQIEARDIFLMKGK